MRKTYLGTVMTFGSQWAVATVALLAAVGVESSVLANGLNLNDSSNGNYTDAGTWTPANDPDDGLADTIMIDSHTVTVTDAGDTTSDTVTVSSGGTLTTLAVAGVLNGASVILNGGTLLKPWQVSVDFGGNIKVAANSVFSGSRWDTYNDSLDFVAPSILTITNAQGGSDPWTAWFRGLTVTNDATLRMQSAGSQSMGVTVTNVTVSSGKTLTVAGTAASGLLTINGTNTAFHGQLTLASGFAGSVYANGSNALGTATVNVSGGTLWSRVPGALVSNTVYVNSGGTLVKYRGSTADFFKGAQIVLNGGTFKLSDWESESSDCGGDVKVTANSTIGCYRWWSTLDSLDFGAPATLTFSQLKSDSTDITFRRFTVTNDATFAFTSAALPVRAIFTNTAVNATNKITVTGTAVSTVQINGPIGARLRGSADVLTGTSFTLVDRVSGTLDYTGSASLDTAGGLWSGSIPADNTDLTVTLANSKGDLNVSSSLSFASEDAAHVVMKNLIAGVEYTVHLDLAGGTGSKAAVKAEMQKNTLWTTVNDSTESGYEVKAVFTPMSSGDFRFAWDNSASGRLGDNLLGVKLTQPSLGTVIVLR